MTWLLNSLAIYGIIASAFSTGFICGCFWAGRRPTPKEQAEEDAERAAAMSEARS